MLKLKRVSRQSAEESLNTRAGTQSLQNQRIRFRSDIEGLRGVAILLVIGYHAGIPGLGGGYVGVDVFFVLSGYLITGLLIGEIESTGKLDLVQFYARRARRLLPAAMVVLLATVIAGRILLSPIEQRYFANTALATALYISNAWFIRQSTDYLAADADTNPLLHTWSLAVEEQFYLCWPLLLLVVLARMRGRSPRWRLGLVMSVAAALSFAGALSLLRIAQPWAFFSSGTRAWEFALGGLALLFADRQRSASRYTHAFGWIGLAAIAAAGVAFNRTTAFPGFAALLPVMGTALVLVAGARDESAGAPGLLSIPGMQWFGRLSYSWYLWHWPAIVFAGAALGESSLAINVVAVIVGLGFAMITHHVVENPVRHNRALTFRPMLTLSLAATLTVCGAGISRWWRIVSSSAAEMPNQKRFTLASTELPRVYAAGCHAAYLQLSSPACSFGDVNSTTTIVLFGDSHAAQWFPAVEQMAALYPMKVHSFTKSECPHPIVRIHNERLGRDYSECSQWREATLRRIVAMKPDVVLLASVHGYASLSPEPLRPSVQEWADGTRAVIKTLTDSGIRVAILRDTPRPGFDVPACLARADWVGKDASECTFVQHSELADVVYAIDRTIASEFKGVLAVDLFPVICPAGTCDVERGDTVLYRDSNHLSARFSASLATALRSALLPILPSDGTHRLARETVDGSRGLPQRRLPLSRQPVPDLAADDIQH